LRKMNGGSVQPYSGLICILPARLGGALLMVSIGILSFCPAFGQTQPDEQPEKVHGTVINSVTHAPVSRALVYSPDNRFATLTDGEGHFEFTPNRSSRTAEGATFFSGQRHQVFSVAGPGGPFWLMARKPGYLDDPNDSRQTQATPGNEFTIALMPEGVIKGRVVASDAEPASEMPVQLFSRQVQEGTPKWVRSNTVLANSNGEFRFAELLPGTYKLATNESMDNNPAITAPGGQVYGFPPVYFPGVPDFASSGTIQLTAGQTVEADLPVTHQPYYSVRIPVANADANAGINVSVSVQGHRGPGYSLGYSPEEHCIVGLLPNGHYLVEAMSFGQSAASGEVNIAVGGSAMEGPLLTLHPGGTITVHVNEEFTSKERTGFGTWSVGGRSFQMRGPRLYLQVRVESEDDLEGERGGSLRPPSGPEDDSMVTENLAPGRYRLRLNTSRGYVASATMGGVDLLHEALVVGPGSSSPIEIKMRDDSAELEGTVTGITPESSAGQGLTTAYVYCIPVRDSPGQFAQVAVSASESKFQLQGIAPGTYRVLAFRNPQLYLPYNDPEAMQAYESNGAVVQLSPGQKANVQVQIISSRE
jgi:hypothetical protein